MEIQTCSEYLAHFCYEYDKHPHKHIYVRTLHSVRTQTLRVKLPSQINENIRNHIIGSHLWKEY